MSQHSYSRCWVHLTWSTHRRQKSLNRDARPRVSDYLIDYARSHSIHMKCNYVNADHAHALIDLPTHLSIEQAIKLLKGGSSRWINENELVPGRFSWGRGYGAFSVSHSGIAKVTRYIANQEEHHRTKTFAEEFAMFVRAYGMEWREESLEE
jgi:REP element-mobilizing transposase RayT